MTGTQNFMDNVITIILSSIYLSTMYLWLAMKIFECLHRTALSCMCEGNLGAPLEWRHLCLFASGHQALFWNNWRSLSLSLSLYLSYIYIQLSLFDICLQVSRVYIIYMLWSELFPKCCHENNNLLKTLDLIYIYIIYI